MVSRFHHEVAYSQLQAGNRIVLSCRLGSYLYKTACTGVTIDIENLHTKQQCRTRILDIICNAEFTSRADLHCHQPNSPTKSHWNRKTHRAHSADRVGDRTLHMKPRLSTGGLWVFIRNPALKLEPSHVIWVAANLNAPNLGGTVIPSGVSPTLPGPQACSERGPKKPSNLTDRTTTSTVEAVPSPHYAPEMDFRELYVDVPVG